MFIVSLTYKAPIETVDQYLAAHSAFLKEQYEKGYFLLSGRKVPRTGGMIIAKISDRKLLDEVIARDPFHINHVADYDITELMPTMTCNELSFLLNK